MRMSFCQFLDELSPEIEVGVEADPVMDNDPPQEEAEPINDDLPEEVTGEVEVVIHPHDEDSQDDIINLGTAASRPSLTSMIQDLRLSPRKREQTVPHSAEV